MGNYGYDAYGADPDFILQARLTDIVVNASLDKLSISPPLTQDERLLCTGGGQEDKSLNRADPKELEFRKRFTKQELRSLCEELVAYMVRSTRTRPKVKSSFAITKAGRRSNAVLNALQTEVYANLTSEDIDRIVELAFNKGLVLLK